MKNRHMTAAVAVTAFIAMLTGCRSPTSDIINNNFIAIAPEPVPAGLEGVWTGNMGPYLVSLQWQVNGEGQFCYSYGTADVLQKVKFSAGTVHIEDGTKFELKEQTDRAITVHSPYGAGQDSILYADPGYQNASAYCAGILNT